MEIGRNEIPNKHPISFINKIRNVIVAFVAMLGLAKPQWKNLMKGILIESHQNSKVPDKKLEHLKVKQKKTESLKTHAIE